MELDERAQEILETLWIRTREAHQDSLPASEIQEEDQAALKHLLDSGMINLHDKQLQLTEEGLKEATNIVRRHRLAERLLADVLDTHDVLLHEKACKFEHLLDKGLDDAICTLLGHPKVCPHGKSIPPGRCCTGMEKEAKQVVASLTLLEPGQKGKIAYLHAPKAERFQKLISMGVLPGAPIELMQRFPSYVFKVRHTQFAVDKELAETIYVRLTASEIPEITGQGEGAGSGLIRRLGWWRRK